jgi:hypothetical protein
MAFSTDPGAIRGGSGCSIVAWSMPSRISAAGRRWARWYDDGHLLNKKNSFTDFIDVTRYRGAKYAAPGRVAAMGGSAGGLLMGGREHGAAGLQGHHRTGALRRRGDDDARRLDPADDLRI